MSPKINDGLSDRQALALLSETDSTRYLLAYGIRTLRRSRLAEITREPMMTLLALGIEKILKSALGLIYLADHREWPPQKQFKDVWRHDLAAMASEVIPALRDRLDLGTHPIYVERLLDEVEQSAAVMPILAALTRYGVNGRFYYLDELAEKPQEGPKPAALWELAERAVRADDRDLDARLTAALGGPMSDFDQLLYELEGRTADAVELLCRLIVMAGRQGLLGERGKGWAFDVDPKDVSEQLREKGE